MDNREIILNVLKKLKTEEDVVRYCSVTKKASFLCREYAMQFFGKSYEDILYTVLIRHMFPTLETVISLKTLFDYYKTGERILELQLLQINHLMDVPMCGYDPDDDMDNYVFEYKTLKNRVIDPGDPENVKYVAPYHKAIVEGAKKIVFVFLMDHLNYQPICSSDQMISY